MIRAGLFVALLAGAAAAVVATQMTGTGTGAPAGASAPDQISLPGGASPGKAGFDGVACNAAFCLAAGADASGHGTISKGTAAGSSWAPVTLPSSVSEVTDVSCGDATHCVAVGPGEALDSSDAGSSWTLHPLPEAGAALVGVACVTGSHCIAVGLHRNHVTAPTDVVLTTDDQGTTWSPVTLPPVLSGPLGGITCPTPKECIAVGADIAITGDGGSTWTAGAVANGLNGALRSVACSSPQDCVAVGPNVAGLQDPSVPAQAFVTTDGGADWAPVTMPAGSDAVTSVSCSPTECVATGSPAHTGAAAPSYTSTDAGRTWTASSPLPSLDGVAAVACPSTGDCVAAGSEPAGLGTAATVKGGGWQLHALRPSPPA